MAEILHGSEKLIQVTREASDKIKKLLSQEQKQSYLRIKISGGGCNGLSYKINFTDQLNKGDILVCSKDVHLLVDSKSALYLRGTTLDFSSKMIGGGFKFTNPNAKSSCSCGESFSV